MQSAPPISTADAAVTLCYIIDATDRRPDLGKIRQQDEQEKKDARDSGWAVHLQMEQIALASLGLRGDSHSLQFYDTGPPAVTQVRRVIIYI